jgi:hypothetical protein
MRKVSKVTRTTRRRSKRVSKSKQHEVIDYRYDGYDNKLRRIGSSYYRRPEIQNTALHVDLCSPLATTLSWSDLESQEPKIAEDIEKSGTCICKRAIEDLRPNVIYAYFKKSRLEKAFKFNGPWSDFETLTNSEKHTRSQILYGQQSLGFVDS